LLRFAHFPTWIRLVELPQLAAYNIYTGFSHSNIFSCVILKVKISGITPDKYAGLALLELHLVLSQSARFIRKHEFNLSQLFN